MLGVIIINVQRKSTLLVHISIKITGNKT